MGNLSQSSRGRRQRASSVSMGSAGEITPGFTVGSARVAVLIKRLPGQSGLAPVYQVTVPGITNLAQFPSTV